jgi:hypothetical protein
MKTTLAALLLASACLAPPAPPARTCRAAKPATALASTPMAAAARSAAAAPMSANLLRNLAREGAFDGDTNLRPTGTPARAGGPAPCAQRHQLGDATCPRTPAELASRLRTSLGDGQVNRLASLYDWNGQSSRQATPILQTLER